MNKVFVYGTLKRGHGNHHFLRGQTFLGEDVIKGKMFSLGAFPCVSMATQEQTIHGEVYEVDDNSLARMDRLEGHPTFYKRELVQTGGGVAAWVYLINSAQSEPRAIPMTEGIWK